jgi:hypothetical protein
VSQLVAEFLRSLKMTEGMLSSPILEELSGILPAEASLADYKGHLTEKYGR